MIGDHLEAYTFDYLMKLGMGEIKDTVDKREGSIVYDSVASCARMLEKGFAELRQTYRDTFAQTSAGDSLSLRAEENGVQRSKATKAVRKGVFTGNDDVPYSLPMGARFTAMGEQAVNYTVIEELMPGTYKLQCEEAGAIGNAYLGDLLPIEPRNGLKTADLTDILIPGKEAENDEELRTRFFAEKNSKKFGGNIDQYREWTMEQDGVGDCQIYPVWDGGGTVKVSFVDSRYRAASREHVETIQRLLDPTMDGQGLGFAPIDHVVTVTTPAEKTVDISATVQIANGFTLDQLRPLITAEIETYFEDCRRGWGKPATADENTYALLTFRSQISAAILRVAGVMNVADLTLNGADADVECREDAQRQELPVLGVVNLA